MAAEVRGVVAMAKGEPVQVVTIVVPDPGPGEAVVRVQACGVCHTDLHYREGGINDEFPFLLGHEAAGVVEAVGPDVTAVAPGDFVVLNWRAVCGECRSCRRGRPWYCFDTHNATQKMTLADGTPSPRPSASAPSPRRPWSPPASAPRSIPPPGPRRPASSAAGSWPASGAAMLTGEVGPGDTVAVFGCGGVGCAAIAGARLAGASTDHRRRPRRPEARAGPEFGATHTVDASSADAVEAIAGPHRRLRRRRRASRRWATPRCSSRPSSPGPGRHPGPGRRAHPGHDASTCR